MSVLALVSTYPTQQRYGMGNIEEQKRRTATAYLPNLSDRLRLEQAFDIALCITVPKFMTGGRNNRHMYLCDHVMLVYTTQGVPVHAVPQAACVGWTVFCCIPNIPWQNCRITPAPSDVIGNAVSYSLVTHMQTHMVNMHMSLRSPNDAAWAFKQNELAYHNKHDMCWATIWLYS